MSIIWSLLSEIQQVNAEIKFGYNGICKEQERRIGTGTGGTITLKKKKYRPLSI